MLSSERKAIADRTRDKVVRKVALFRTYVATTMVLGNSVLRSLTRDRDIKREEFFILTVLHWYKGYYSTGYVSRDFLSVVMSSHKSQLQKSLRHLENIGYVDLQYRRLSKTHRAARKNHLYRINGKGEAFIRSFMKRYDHLFTDLLEAAADNEKLMQEKGLPLRYHRTKKK